MRRMGYIPLAIEETRWPLIARFVRGPLESLYFRDAHDLLRLPQREAGLAGGCNFAIARVLLSAVSSLSRKGMMQFHAAAGLRECCQQGNHLVRRDG